MKSITILIISICINISIADARILNVPDEYETIREGIAAAEDGDTVLVAPGVYEGSLALYDLSIVLASHYLTTGQPESIDSTIIVGDENQPINIFTSSRLCGFTIRDGCGIRVQGSSSLDHLNVRANSSPQPGGGVSIDLTRNDAGRVDLSHLLIEGNRAEFLGGGLYISSDADDRVTVTDVIIRDNVLSMSYGGGVAIGGGVPVFRNVQITGNITEHGGGAGVYSLDGDPEFYNCLVSGNRSSSAAAAMHLFRSHPVLENVTVTNNVSGSNTSGVTINGSIRIRNSIFWNNSGVEVGGLRADSSSFVLFSLIDTSDGGVRLGDELVEEGNLTADPLFLDPDNGDYSLSPDSPCIDSGDPDSPENPDGTRADMGAFYFHQRDIVVEPDSIIFPVVGWGDLDSLPAEIRNIGGNTLHLTGIISPLDMSCIFFRPEGRFDPPLAIEPDSSMIVWFYIRPDSAASFEGSAIIYSDDPDEDSLVVITRGEPPSAVPSETSHFALYTLHSAFPNPFNSSTTIRFSTGSQAAPTRLAVYGIDGRLVEEFDGKWKMENGTEHSVVWNAEGLPAGIYLIRLESESEVKIIKAVLMK